MSKPQAANHADLYEIVDRIGEVVEQLANADIALDGLFCDLDAGLMGRNSGVLLSATALSPYPKPRNGGASTEEWIYDELMYKQRWRIERTNAWMYGFKSVLNRFDTTLSSWKG